MVREPRRAEEVAGPRRLVGCEVGAERPGLPEEFTVRTELSRLDGHGGRLLGRAFVCAAVAGDAKARARLRGRRQGHGQRGARRACGRLAESVQGRREGEVSTFPTSPLALFPFTERGQHTSPDVHTVHPHHPRSRRHATGAGHPHARAVGPRDCVALRRPDDAVAAGDQHLPADLDDQALVHQLSRQPAERERAGRGHRQLRVGADRPRHLARDAGHGPLPVLDHRAADADRLRARLPDRPQVPRPRFLDHDDPDSDDVVTRRRRQFLGFPLPAADRPVQLCRVVLHRHSAVVVRDDRLGETRTLGHHHRRHLDVDALRDADLPGRVALDPRLHLRSGRSRPRLHLAPVLVDHAADGSALHHAGGLVPRHRELQDVRHGEPADLGRAGFGNRAGIDHAQARSLREVAHRLFVGFRDHPFCRGVRPGQHLCQGPQPREEPIVMTTPRPLSTLAVPRGPRRGPFVALGACRAWGVEAFTECGGAKTGPSEDSFCPVRRPIAVAMGQEAGEKWTAAVSLQPTLPKPDRLLGRALLGAARRGGSKAAP